MIVIKTNEQHLKREEHQFNAKVKLEIISGRFIIKTISSYEELRQAFFLRYQVFQVELIGNKVLVGEDYDEFDRLSDHIGIFDKKSNQMIATCRLNCSLFASKFYSEQEFDCASLMSLPGIKLEVGRVCVHRDFRKGVVIMLLWRAIAEYMKQTDARFLFGCGSVATLDPTDAVILYRFLEETGKIRSLFNISPSKRYHSEEFARILLEYNRPLALCERQRAESLLPSLCRSYFDIGCFSPGVPAFDYEFKCIDFLTVLNVTELNPQIRRKIMGTS